MNELLSYLINVNDSLINMYDLCSVCRSKTEFHTLVILIYTGEPSAP